MAYALIDHSFLNDKMKRTYKRVIEERKTRFIRQSEKNRYYAQLPEHHSQVNHVRKQEIGQNSLTSLRPASPASLPNEQGKSCSLFGLCYVESTSNLHRIYIESTSKLHRTYARKTSTLFRSRERVCSVTALITKAPSSVGDGALFNMRPCRGCRRR